MACYEARLADTKKPVLPGFKFISDCLLDELSLHVPA
jgi:hypothetical protein